MSGSRTSLPSSKGCWTGSGTSSPATPTASSRSTSWPSRRSARPRSTANSSPRRRKTPAACSTECCAHSDSSRSPWPSAPPPSWRAAARVLPPESRASTPVMAVDVQHRLSWQRAGLFEEELARRARQPLQVLLEVDGRAFPPVAGQAQVLHDRIHDLHPAPVLGPRRGEPAAGSRYLRAIPGVHHLDDAPAIGDASADLVLVVGPGVLDDIGAGLAQGQGDVRSRLRRHAEDPQAAVKDLAADRHARRVPRQGQHHLDLHASTSGSAAKPAMGFGDLPYPMNGCLVAAGGGPPSGRARTCPDTCRPRHRADTLPSEIPTWHGGRFMPADAGNAAGSFSTQVARRWQAIDPLLPAGGGQRSGCGARLIVAGAGGEPAATGTCEHLEGSPESLDLTWGAARRFHLTVRLAGSDAAAALDQLLSLWRDHLDGVPGAEGEDAAAIVTWPSRDIDGAATLLQHGLAPLSVIAARATRRHPAGP